MNGRIRVSLGGAMVCVCMRLPVPGRVPVAACAWRRSRSCVVRASEAEAPPDSAAGLTPEAGRSLVSRTAQLLTLEGAAADGVLSVNHYEVLNVPRGSSKSEIATAFQKRCEELMAQTELDKDSSMNQLRVLQESFEVLTVDEERILYDWSLQRSEHPEGPYIWPYEVDMTQSAKSKLTPPMLKPVNDEEGDRKVALFFLAWFIISIVFSVTMKTYRSSPPF